MACGWSLLHRKPPQLTTEIRLDRGYNRGYTILMKTAISIPDDLFAVAEAASKRLGVSRSHFYARAVAAYLEEHAADGVTEKLNEVYANVPSHLDPLLERMQWSTLPPNEW